MTAIGNLSDYTIVRASGDQLIQHARICYIHWHHNASFETFLEGTLREHTEEAWGKGGLHEVWVLVRRDDPSGYVYSGCEVYRRRALIKRKGRDVVEDGWTYAIASVVTQPEHCRKGYATHLLRLLHYTMADSSDLPSFPQEWGGPPPASKSRGNDAIGSILFSDVGFEFYEKCTIGLDRPGWVVKPEDNIELVWEILDESSSDAAEPTVIDDDSQSIVWEWIYEDDMPRTAETLSQAARRDLEGCVMDHTIWRTDPASPGVLTWLAKRGPWMSTLTAPPPDSSEPYGIRTTNPDGSETIVLFTGYNGHVGDALLVTYALNLRPEHLASLLRELDKVGRRAGKKEGWIWGLEMDGELMRAWKGIEGRKARVGTRKDVHGHLLGVAGYCGEGDRAELVDRQMWHWC